MRKALFVALALLLVAGVLPGCQALAPAAAQFPTKQVTYLVCFDPGGPSDKEARRQQPILEQALGQKILIDYKVGGGGALCWSELSKAKPDGYTVAGINIPHIILMPLQQETGFKTDDLDTIAIFQGTAMGLAVLKTSPYQTLADVVKYAKANPGKLNVGGVGTYTGHHFGNLLFQKLAGVQFNYVPFTGAAAEMPAFLGGHVDAIFGNSDDLVKYNDQVRVLAFSTATRYERFPDVPTMKELGYDMVMGIERGIAAPKGTPESALKALEAAFVKIMKDPQIQEQLKKEGYVPLTMNRADSKAYIDKAKTTYAELAKGLSK